MSRVGKYPVIVPDGVSVSIEAGNVVVKGKTLQDIAKFVAKELATIEIKNEESGKDVVVISDESKIIDRGLKALQS